MKKKTPKIRWNPEALWLARRRQKKTQDEIARTIKRARRTVIRAEQGTHASEALLQDLCQVLEVPLADVLIS